MLRAYFRRALHRRNTTSGQAAGKIRKWPFEDQMQFLKHRLQERELRQMHNLRKIIQRNLRRIWPLLKRLLHPCQHHQIQIRRKKNCPLCNNERINKFHKVQRKN
uniref:Uncharacterized protein n=1 Tax=Timema douglasi TaxID=61478 RepID=A0A7R8VZ26_TIMDO|nr:unnamed protein product [Timema douglasi]